MLGSNRMKTREGQSLLVNSGINSIFDRVMSLYQGSPTKTDKRIALFIQQNRETLVDMTVSQLAQSCGASSATLVRFVRKLGFEGFPDFRRKIIEELKEELQNPFSLAPVDLFKSPILRRFAEKEITNAQLTLKEISEETILNIANKIAICDTLYTTGSGVSSIFAKMATYQFSACGMRSTCLCDVPIPEVDQLALAMENSVFLCFAFLPYSQATIETLKFAKEERGMTTVVITNLVTSEATEVCDFVLRCSSATEIPMNSITAPLIVLRGLLSVFLSLNVTKNC